MTTQQKVWDKDAIIQLLDTNDQAVAKAILTLFARQTEDEQSDETTRVRNGRGFNANDAPFLTSIAKALPRWRNHMTDRQLAKARPMLRKYWRQLLEEIEANGGLVVYDAPPARPRELAKSLNRGVNDDVDLVRLRLKVKRPDPAQLAEEGSW